MNLVQRLGLVRIRSSMLVVGALALCPLAACDDDDGDLHAKHSLDASSPDPGTGDAGDPAGDAGTAPPSSSGLARPGLPRPPLGGLPADLRPPR
jgi:hypothetical protein